jgi:hypothetical protein
MPGIVVAGSTCRRRLERLCQAERLLHGLVLKSLILVVSPGSLELDPTSSPRTTCSSILRATSSPGAGSSTSARRGPPARAGRRRVVHDGQQPRRLQLNATVKTLSICNYY